VRSVRTRACVSAASASVTRTTAAASVSATTTCASTRAAPSSAVVGYRTTLFYKYSTLYVSLKGPL